MSGQPSQGEKRTGDDAWPDEQRRTLIPQKRICLTILGMHRSGTSALARVLSILGAKLPATLNTAHGGGDTNWESTKLIGYDDALLAELGSSWQDWQPLDWTRVPMRRRGEIKAEIAELLDAEFGVATPIVVKEPRICRFAPLFFDALESADFEVRCLLPVRSPLEVIESLARRDGMPRGEAALLWLRHVLEAEIATRSRPRAILSYDSLLSDWRGVVGQITERLSLRWKHPLADVEPQIGTFLTETRRHHKSRVEDLLVDPLLRTWMADAYSALLVLERNPQSETALETLDRIRATFNDAAPIIERLLADARENHKLNAAPIEPHHAVHNISAADLEQAVQAARSEVAAEAQQALQVAVQAAAEQARQDAGAEADRRVAEESDRGARNLAEATLAAEQRDTMLNSHIRVLEQALDEERVVTRRLASELNAATLRGDKALAALEESAAALTTTRAQLAERDAALLAAQAEVRRRIAVISSLESALGASRRTTAQLRAEIEAGNSDKARLQAALTEKDRAIEAAQTEIARRDAKLRAASAAAAASAQVQETQLQAAAAEVRNMREQAEGATSRAEQADAEIARLRDEVHARDVHLHQMGSSTSWRITRPIRGAKRLFTDPEFRRQLPRRVFGGDTGQPLRRWTLPWAQHVVRRLLIDQRYRSNALSKTRRVLKGQYGEEPFRAEPQAPAPTLAQIEPTLKEVRPLEPYEAWLRANALTDGDRADLRAALALREGRTPKLSALMPVYNSDPRLLREIVDCVRGQIYENWELCLVDDCSPAPHVKPLLKEIARLDSRIKVKHRATNGGIAECTNSAAAMADGDIVVFIDHDDLITPDCFAELALYYADHAEADIVYSDDDKVDMNGARSAPQFKPDYAPALLMSFMYIGHVFSVRRSLFNDLGGFRKAFDGSQDYDFALRAVERARHVGHIPKVLYSWRIAPGSTAASADAKPESFEAGRKAVEEALARRGATGRAVHPDWARAAKCGIFSVEFPDTGPAVTLIIPTHDKVELLRACVESLSRTTYRDFQVMVVDNDSKEPETLAYLREIERRPNVRVERISNNGNPFSYARINNEAVRRAQTEFVLLLNNDTEVREPRWLSQMMGHAQMQGVGAVGAKLLFGDGTIQHAGIVHGMYNGMAGPAFRNRDCHDWGYLNFLKVSREYAAVTAACLLVRKDLYERIGGLDERRFNVAYNDVDFCYRIVDQGLSCIYCAEAELFHYEGKTRGHRDNPREVAAFRMLYRGRIDGWYNANLSLEDEHFRVRGARPPRRAQKPVRAVMVSHNLEHEGAPNSMMELVSGLKRRGFADPIVLSPVDGPLRAHYESAGVEVQVIRNPIADIHDEPAFLASMDDFARMLRRLGAEVVYGNTLQTFWAMTGANAAGLPSIWNPRESEAPDRYFDYLAPSLRRHAYSAFASSYAVVYVANATRENWRSLNTRHNTRVIHNGISMDRLSARAGTWTRESARAKLGFVQGEVCATLVGTVCDRKGQIDLVEAIRRMPQHAINRARFQIVGDRAGPYSQMMHDAAATLPADRRERLNIVAETGDPYLYFRASDIALCTSRIESYPRVILEAMACGLPIVTTSVFGIAEQVREDVNAFFYQPEQSDVLARHIARLVEDDALRARMSDNSPLVLQCLTQFDEMIEAYGAVFREAAGAPVERMS